MMRSVIAMLLASSIGPTASTAWAQGTATATAAPEPGATPVSAGYEKGFFIRSRDELYALGINGRVQARYAHELLEGEDDLAAFSIARARLSLGGHAFSKSVKYKFQADFGKGFVSLKDFYLDLDLLPGTLVTRVGQFKRPFSRQQLSSSGKLQVVDRAPTDKVFQGTRDIGVMIHNDFERSPRLELALGIFNGSGETPIFSGATTVDPVTLEGTVEKGKFSNVPEQIDPALVLRVGTNLGKLKGYSEADLEGGPLRLGLGASVLAQLDADRNDQSALRAELDFIVKVEGLSGTGGLYLSSLQSGTSITDRSTEAVGLHLQAGYLIGGLVEPLLRYALIAPAGPDNELQELGAGLSLYFFGHNLKWQSEGAAILEDGAAGSTTRVLLRTQAQLAF